MTARHTHTRQQPYEAQAPGGEASAETAGPDDRTLYADWRYQAVERVQLMCSNFKINVWEQRFSADRLAPHSLAYLYLQADQRRRKFFQVATAWQLWLDHPDVRSLPQLLFELHHQFAPRAASSGFDIREELSVGRDAHMGTGTAAVYAGLAVISLDTEPGTDNPNGTWEQVQKTARSPLDVPALTRIVLTDGTMMVCYHGTRFEYSAFTVQSTHELKPAAGSRLFEAYPVPAQDLREHANHRDVLRWAAELSDTLAQADNGRISSLKAAHATGRQGRRHS
ncbi:hypothetical protein AB0B31_10645 [Catellatospora citrea]|uniref:hypothetical protein n=1 Tax=Catellatospora citrea TaxID=53366 RepID=UPI0033CB85E1